MITRLFAILILSTFAVAAYSQDGKVDEYRLQQEQMRRTALLRELDSGVFYMDDGRYDLAEKKFKYVLDNIRSVPSDLVFYFGKNSFYRENYKQSIDWLNKYLQLKGTSGQFSEEAVSWLKKAEAEFLHEKSKEAQKAEQVFSTSYEVDCGPAGKVVCPVCKGEHVVIKRAALGTEYRTCPYCDDQGALTCAEYNPLVRGELKPKN